MFTLRYGTLSYEVDHAVKGPDYVHGYDANGVCVVAIDGVTDFSNISYSGEYMSPNTCITESCNDVKYCNSELVTRDNRKINTEFHVTIPVSAWENSLGESYPNFYTASVNVEGLLRSDTIFADVELWGGSPNDNIPLLEAWDCVGRVFNENNKVILYCYNGAPAVDLPIFIKAVR